MRLEKKVFDFRLNSRENAIYLRLTGCRCYLRQTYPNAKHETTFYLLFPRGKRYLCLSAVH